MLFGGGVEVGHDLLCDMRSEVGVDFSEPGLTNGDEVVSGYDFDDVNRITNMLTAPCRRKARVPSP